jgi:ankyrin repeat protein
MSLLAAIRAGDREQASDLLQRGADVNTRDEAGETALMLAASGSDAAMMRLLLDRGADLHARSPDRSTAFVRGIHDHDKTRLLLNRGARVENRAVVLCAMISGSGKTLQLLLDRGGDANANVGGFSALSAAAYNGDAEAVACLLEKGADVHMKTAKGYTAVHAAVVSGNVAVLRALLERGADPNARYAPPNSEEDAATPVVLAAWRGDGSCLKELLARHADVNFQDGPFERTALLCGATTGSEEVARLLLAAGADPNARDWAGHTPLYWARRRGITPVVRLLERPGVKDPSRQDSARERARLHKHLEAASVPGAVAAGLRLLQDSARKFSRRENCVSCHHQSLVALTVGLARQGGVAVDEESASQQREQVRILLGVGIPGFLLAAGIDPLLPAYTLVGFAAEEEKASRLTDALVHYLVLRQRKNGHWAGEVPRPPEEGSDFMFTALSVHGLQSYAPKGRSKEISARMAAARNWLLRAQPSETVDKVFHLLGLHWAHASKGAIETAARLLLREQRTDGGWAQLPTLPSDAYATGQVLFALHEAGSISVTDPVYRRGVSFLLASQLADGSWFVPTRTFPLLESTNSGFPHGRSQFISASATCWATLALVPLVKAETTLPKG